MMTTFKKKQSIRKEIDEIARLLHEANLEEVEDEDLSERLINAEDEYLLRLIFDKKKETVN
jgi:hypothetical protein